MAMVDCKVRWAASASLKELVLPVHGSAWVGEPLYDGTIAGAIAFFRQLSPERQRRTEMMIDRDDIEGLSKAIVEFENLAVIASRSDLPEV